MTPEKTKKAFAACAELLSITPYDGPAVRTRSSELIDFNSEPERVVGHLRFCCEEGQRLVDQGRMEKAFRWLGFVQGAIWTMGLCSLDVLKEMNMPEPEEPDVWPGSE